MKEETAGRGFSLLFSLFQLFLPLPPLPYTALSKNIAYTTHRNFPLFPIFFFPLAAVRRKRAGPVGQVNFPFFSFNRNIEINKWSFILFIFFFYKGVSLPFFFSFTEGKGSHVLPFHPLPLFSPLPFFFSLLFFDS